jgi:hypothetical protein
MSGPDLQKLLERACPNPSILSSNAGAVLSLALNCLMGEEGYTLDDSNPPGCAPPAGWHSKFKHEWVFSYTRPGKANKFVLHCSLQIQTNRMFVHASEPLNESNIQILGLSLDNYVPNPEPLSSGRWEEGVVQRADGLHEMFKQYITEPLTTFGVDLPVDLLPPRQAAAATSTSFSLSSLSTTHYVVLGSAVVIAIAIVFQRYRHR